MADTNQSLYKYIVQRLNASFADEEARAMADRLFEHYLNLTPTQRVLSGAMPADKKKIHFLEEGVNKLLNQVPLQYILGSAFFMDMELMVNSAVLIPRPETEELVSRIIKYTRLKEINRKINVLDIGTGSGCIAIALKRNLPDSHVTAIDISQDALDVATVNSARYNAGIDYKKADILDKTSWTEFAQCDIIVSNPPYILHAEKPLMLPNVLDNEPHTALFVPDDDPLLFYRAILALAKIKLVTGGSVWFEINERFGDELKVMALNQEFSEANIFFDIRGKSRFLHVLK